ncbi:MAG: DNA polymerase III subunit delta [Armatimonadetes bacterium]|nr:DNA polymerase III subunit delta [Armatimonadota bacterium]
MATFSLEKALASRVVLLSGDEDALRKRALAEILAAIEDPDGFDREHFESDSPAGKWLASASTIPFLSERRVVIVRRILRADMSELSPDKLKALPASSMLILVADEEASDSNREKGGSKGKWEALVDQGGGYVSKLSTPPGAASQQLKAEATRLGKQITPRALDLLLDMTGGNLTRGLDELDKLALLVGTGSQIREEDVRMVAVPSREWRVFTLVDEVLDRNIAGAFTQLQILLEGAKSDDAVFSSLIPTFHWTLRMLFQAVTLKEAGLTLSKISEEDASKLPTKNNLQKAHPFVAKKMERMAARLTSHRAAKLLKILGDADARMRGAETKYSTAETLERMTLEMAAV